MLDQLKRYTRVSMLGLTVAIFVFAFHSSSAWSQVIEPTKEDFVKLDAKIEAFMEKINVPGVQYSVASRGKIIYQKSYGMANVELSVKVNEHSVFEIGSISKQFVTAAVMLQHEEGKIGLDDPIHNYLAYLPSEWLGVTVRQLMTHTSGIPDYEEIRTYDAYRYRFTPEEIIKIAHSRPMDFEPGQGYYYSNTGYFLLSMIVERVDGKPLEKALYSRIFGPLGMASTGLANPEDIIKNRASGYWVNKVGELINRNPTETSSTLGAGGILSSAHDLALWDNALHGTVFLSAASKKEMWTSAKLPSGKETGYGFGWNVRDFKGLKSQGHSGQVAGFIAYFQRFPEQGVSFIIFMNRYRARNTLRDDVITTFMPSLKGEK
jgi:CubicO group peptidase (beta-lactamase class C family)